MIQVYTYQNSLKVSEGKDKYRFRSVVDQILDNEQLVKEIISYNSTITEADVRAVLSVLNDRVKRFVNLGYKVELPFGYVYNKANAAGDYEVKLVTKPGTERYEKCVSSVTVSVIA